MAEGAATSGVFEPAPSGRAKCRGCGELIPRGELRFGERLPNPYAEGETTVWFHRLCAAYKRPQPVLQSLGEAPETVTDRDTLERAARRGLAHRRLPRIDGAERAPSGRARCRSCREPIDRGSWRIRLAFYEEGRFTPGGFVHLGCREDYFETGDVLRRLFYFSPSLSSDERDELKRELDADP